jgi:hypothetical protein
MKINISLILVIIGLTACSAFQPHPEDHVTAAEGQLPDEDYQKVFQKLQIQDSLLFELGFNQCDTQEVKRLTSTDFEFYHDQAGILHSQESFLQSISGLCNMDYKPTRELEPSSLSVYLLRNEGEIYGAIQNGQHRFYAKETNHPKYLTSTANFTHLWIIEEGTWKLKRVLSYNHQGAEQEK